MSVPKRIYQRLCRWHGFDWGYLFVSLSTIPTLLLLFRPGYFASHDGLHHLYRLYDLDWTIHGGPLYPRWLPNLGFGYGYPVLNYYAPLTYYVAELFHLLGAGYIASIELVFAFGFLLSGATMYLYAKEFLGRWPAVVAAVAYMYLPYHLADGFVRGALAEFFAFIFLPLVLWAFYRLVITGEGNYIPVAAASYAGLILTHNLTALIFTPLLFSYLAFLWLQRRRFRPRAYLTLAMILGWGLAAFYWLPGLMEVSWVRLGQVGPVATDYRQQLVPFSEFFSPFLIYRYFPNQGVKLEHPLSCIQLGLAALSLIALFRVRGLTRHHLLFFQATTLVSLFMILSYSSFLWEALPLLPYLRFPWRFLVLASVGTSILIGSLVLLFSSVGKKEGRAPWSYAVGLGILGVLMASSLPHLPVEPLFLPDHPLPLGEEEVTLATMAEYDYFNELRIELWGSIWGFEYLPRWVAEAGEEFFLPLAKPSLPEPTLSPSDIPNIVLGEQEPLSRLLRVRSEKGMRLSFHTFYFPGWRIYVDGKPQDTYPSRALGLVTVDIPFGDHQILLRFEDTLAQRIGFIIAFLSLLTLLAILVLEGQGQALLVASGALVLLLVFLGWRLSLWTTVEHPHELQANLENKVKLLGYNLDRSEYRPGDVLHLTLYWLCLSEMDQDYKVFVHLTNEEGTELISQSDQWPVYNFSPTTRWEVGEIVVDRHETPIPRDAASGSYRLLTGMYLLETMRNLDILDQNMTPIGNRVFLTSIWVVRE